MGRPTILTRDIAEKFAEYVRAGNTLRCAAASVGVSWNIVKFWLREGKAGKEPYLMFHTLTRAAEAEAESTMTKAVASNAALDWKAASWWLERRRGREWWLAKPGRGVPKKPNEMTDEELKEVLVGELAKWAQGDEAFIEKVIARIKGTTT